MRPPSDPFMGVTLSASGRTWRDRLTMRERREAEAIAQRFAISDILARILAGRGTSVDTVEEALKPTLRHLMPEPMTLTDMSLAVARLVQAVEAAEPVAIFGDYDVDGAASCAVMARLLGAYGVPIKVHIPDRITEGYGPTNAIIQRFSDEGFRLILLLDCGTMSFDAIAEARRLGAEVIVIDHHQADLALPEALAVVNPNRQDDLSRLGHLCAAGVTFVVAVALNRALRERGFFNADRNEVDLLSVIDLVGLATVADVVPLIGLNRAFVARGLESLNRQPQAGLGALIKVGRIEGPVESFHLGFVLGPRINAGGRIGEAGLGCRLLMSDEAQECERLAADLDRLNRERQVIEQAAVDEAIEEMTASIGMGEGPSVLVASAPHWHPGVLGLIAARLKEKFERPAFALALKEGMGTGSGRSISGVDLGRTVRQAVSNGLLIKGGGHSMAAGLTISTEQLAAFRAFLESELSATVRQSRLDRQCLIDAAMTAASATRELVHDIERAGPYGTGRPEPMLVFPAHRLTYVGQAGTTHLRLTLQSQDGRDISAMAFRAIDTPLGHFLNNQRGKIIHAAGTLSINRWQGRERVQLRLVDAASAQF